MTYTVKYKLKNSLFWNKIKRVSGDLFVQESKCRCFILDDETRLEIPFDGTQFIFSKDRFLVIKKNMEREVGQNIPTLRQ